MDGLFQTVVPDTDGYNDAGDHMVGRRYARPRTPEGQPYANCYYEWIKTREDAERRRGPSSREKLGPPLADGNIEGAIPTDAEVSLAGLRSSLPAASRPTPPKRVSDPRLAGG